MSAFTKAAIEKMDKTSDEFFELYQMVCDKYWDIDNPCENQMQRKVLHEAANRAEDWMVEMNARILKLVFEAREGGAFSACFEVPKPKGEDFKMIYVNAYDDPKQLDKLQKMLMNTVTVKAEEMRKSGETEASV